MSKKDSFEERYKTGDTPWDRGTVSPELKRVLKENIHKKGKVFEIGCGTGTDARFLADNGWAVTATDLVNSAIEIAKKRSTKYADKITYLVHDFLDPLDNYKNSMDLVFDRGCFHSIDKEHRAIFVKNVNLLLNDNGHWLTLCGSSDEKSPHDSGPPRLSATEIITELETKFEIVKFESIRFHGNGVKAWLCLSKKRVSF